jgi:hypothetical protein
LGFLDRLDEIAPGYGRIADWLRGGFSEQDYERVRGDAQINRLPQGPITALSSINVRGRRAHMGTPAGWVEHTPSELAMIQAQEGPDGEVHAALNHADASPEVLFSLRVCSFVSDALRAANQERWPLEVERQTGLRTVSRIRRVDFAGSVGYYWSLQGTMEGLQLGRPNQPIIDLHSGEMWALLDHGAILKFLCLAPIARAQEATEALNTAISSWQW